MSAFDEAALRVIIEILPQWHRLAFIASCAERVLPFYEAFARQDNLQSHEGLRRALDTIWKAAIARTVLRSQCDEIRDSLDAAAPDPDRVYSSPFVPNASDALDLMEAAFSVMSRREDDFELDVQCAVDSAILARSTIDLYLALVTLPEFVPIDIITYKRLGKVDYTVMPMFLAEVQKQEEDLTLLRSATTVDDAVLSSLRDRGFIGAQPVKRFSL